MEINLTDPKTLAKIVKEFSSSENIDRKQRSYVAYDIYNNNQHDYVVGCLKGDYPKETIKSMRKITSINFAKRIVNVEANIYKHDPVRTFNGGDDKGLEQLENIYRLAEVDLNNKQLNRFYRMDEQCAVLIVPNKTKGTIGMRKLQNWQYDVIPDPSWPDQALAYIIPVTVQPGEYSNGAYYAKDSKSDGQNQTIADRNDKDLSDSKFILWSKEFNFMFDGNGKILTDKSDMENPIGIMPIIDISMPKQNSFLLDNDNNLSRFTIDFLCMVSDLAEIIRMQGYSQAILSALEKPKDIMVGPHRIMFLQKKKKADASEQPEFKFATPSPDLAGTLDGLLAILRMFLSSRGHKTNVVTGSTNVESFASGLERLLAMIEEHESSIDDFALFKSVEQQEFEIFKAYSNYLQDDPIEGFELHEDLKGGAIPDDSTMEIKFHEPQMIETEKEKQARLGERLDNETMTKKAYIMELDNVDEEKADAVLKEIDAESGQTNDPGQ